VVPHLIPGGVMHLQFADDTMILIETSDEGTVNLKLILLSLDMMLGLNTYFGKN
jgi:hypothetical protein